MGEARAIGVKCPGLPSEVWEEEWPLRRYGRLRRPGDAQETVEEWKIFDSNDDSGKLTLAIVSTGHFFISQGHTLLEGFSLISAETWLKVGRKSDCLLFGSKIQQESRMFRVQFNGESKEEAIKTCDRCIQKLQMYVPVKNGSLGIQNVPEEIITVKQMAQSVLEATPNYQHPALSKEELGPFLRLCLLDQHFPAFVEAVEEELHKLTEN
ncbi:meiotic recombination protein REC114 [Discoglossus pictus]